MQGTAGMTYFNEILAKVEAYKQIFSKGQKLRLAAIKRQAEKQDFLGDWSKLIDALFKVWEEAIQ